MLCSRLAAGVVALAVVLLGQASRASTEPTALDKPRANALLAEARQLYDHGEYADALDRLNQAYAAFPSPVIHFNFGQVYRALTRDVEAIEAFDRFLSEGTDQDPTLRHEAEIYFVELSRRIGTIEIAADLAGAEVSIDGKPAGTTPLKRGIRVAPGPHQVLVQSRAGGTPFLHRVDIAGGQIARVEAKVARPPPAIVTAPISGPEPAPRIYQRWWFWAGVGAVVLGAVATTVALTRSTERCPYNAGCVTVP